MKGAGAGGAVGNDCCNCCYLTDEKRHSQGRSGGALEGWGGGNEVRGVLLQITTATAANCLMYRVSLKVGWVFFFFFEGGGVLFEKTATTAAATAANCLMYRVSLKVFCLFFG